MARNSVGSRRRVQVKLLTSPFTHSIPPSAFSSSMAHSRMSPFCGTLLHLFLLEVSTCLAASSAARFLLPPDFLGASFLMIVISCLTTDCGDSMSGIQPLRALSDACS